MTDLRLTNAPYGPARMCVPGRDFVLRIAGVMKAHAPSRPSLLAACLAALLLTAAGGTRNAQAATKHKHHKKAVHHKGHAPSGGGSAAEPESGGTEESAEPSGGSTGASSESSESRPAAEPEAAPSGSEEAAPAPKRKKVKVEGETAAEEPPSAPSGLPWLDISIGVAGYNRNFTFHQDADPPGSQLNPYALPFWPVGLVNGVVYLEPLASALGNLGIEGHAMQGFGVSSKFSNSSTSFTSTVHDYSGGLRYRFPFGDGNWIFVSGRYGEDAFTFNGQNRASLRTPDTIYHYARPGVGLRLLLNPDLSLDLGAGYRAVLNSAGPQISGSQFLPHLTTAGADASVDLTYAFSDIYALRAGVEWRRYWYDFHARAGDTYLVGGGIDQSFLFSVSLVLTIGGSSHAEAEAAPAPAKAKPAKAKTDEGGESGGSSDEGSSDSGSKSGGGDEP